MTLALCFSCGATKFGALCPCSSCEAASTGNVGLDIAFSDHRLAPATLKEFGAVVRAIAAVCDDDGLRLRSFLYLVSTRYPEILRIELSADKAARCAAVLEEAAPPAVTLRPGRG